MRKFIAQVVAFLHGLIEATAIATEDGPPVAPTKINMFANYSTKTRRSFRKGGLDIGI
jgi:hypothetical protein